MDKLNEYLQDLVSTCGSELHLEPNKTPYTVSANGINHLGDAVILGTQISMMVFPLIPANVKKELPNKPEVDFVLPHNLGNFNFVVKKSPAGFVVTITPQDAPKQTESAAPAAPFAPQIETPIPQFPEPAPVAEVSLAQDPFISAEANPQTDHYQEVASQEEYTPSYAAIPSPFTAEVSSPSVQAYNQDLIQDLEEAFGQSSPSQDVQNSQVFEFESASMQQPQPEVIYQSPDLIVDSPQDDFQPSIPQVETASVNDPEFITTFSDTSTYDEPGSKYDYEVEVIPQSTNNEEFLAPQSHSYAESAPAVIQTYSEPEPTYTAPVEAVETTFAPAFEPLPQIPQPQEAIIAPAPASFEMPAEEAVFAPAAANLQAQNRMDALFYKMAEEKASDLHISVSSSPMVRKDGKMQLLDCIEGVLTPESARELLTSIMPAKNQEEFAQRNDTDFAYEIKGLARFRANIFMDRKGMGGVFRIIPSKILTAEQLNLSKAIMDLCNLSKGLVVVTGPTGSGKSTTLCAMVDSINKSREDHIITIEDPIEFTHDNQKCLVNQREVHNHTDSFKDALRAALREDPDILLVGEMRDLETISIAIETAETGHLVFGTLHTTTAASTIDRIIDQFPADRQQQIRVMLSESLKGVIAQTLLPKKGGGRVAALEVLIVTPAISNLIREGKTFQIPSAMQTGKNLGMVMLNDALFAHVQSGAVEPRDAYIKAVDKAGFESLLTRNGFKL